MQQWATRHEGAVAAPEHALGSLQLAACRVAHTASLKAILHLLLPTSCRHSNLLWASSTGPAGTPIQHPTMTCCANALNFTSVASSRAAAGMSRCWPTFVCSEAHASLAMLLRCAWAGTRACEQAQQKLTILCTPTQLHGARHCLSYTHISAQSVCMCSLAALHHSQPLQRALVATPCSSCSACNCPCACTPHPHPKSVL